MVYLHKQKNKRKHAYINRKNQSKDTVSRHAKLKNKVNEANKNADLFFSPVNEFMKQEYESQKKLEGGSQSDEKSDKGSAGSSDSGGSKPGLTGSKHIMMERNVFANNYVLEQVGTDAKTWEMCKEHFQPIFFARNTNELRDDVKAQKALKQYRIFVKPEDMKDDIVEYKPLPTMDIAESLEKRIKKQQDEDLKRYRIKRNNVMNPVL